MSGAEFDVSELVRFMEDVRHSADDIPAKAEQVVAKGALNIKNQMRDEAEQSEHFKIAGLISYDLEAGPARVKAEIGPRKVGAGRLANIAYFGGVNGGGGSIPDPQGALDVEEPKFTKAIDDIVDGLFS